MSATSRIRVLDYDNTHGGVTGEWYKNLSEFAGGSSSWGGISGSISNQTDLQAALDGKAAVHAHPYEASGAVAAHAAAADPHPTYTTAAEAAAAAPVQSVAGRTGTVALTKADVGLANVDNTADTAKPISSATQTALDAKEPANANLQAHVAAPHAPANAQKNSDITLAEIEAKLIGVISSHSHAGGGSDPFVFKAALAADASTGANTTPISLSGFTFSFAANSTYFIDIAGATRAPATTTGGGFHLDVSAAVTRVGMTHTNQLANTGTLTGGSSIADDASIGVSSGRPSANTDTPVMGSGYLMTGVSAGTATLRYRSEVAAVSTVMSGFVMRVMKIT